MVKLQLTIQNLGLVFMSGKGHGYEMFLLNRTARLMVENLAEPMFVERKVSHSALFLQIWSGGMPVLLASPKVISKWPS
jgi:hypothetical protein